MQHFSAARYRFQIISVKFLRCIDWVFDVFIYYSRSVCGTCCIGLHYFVLDCVVLYLIVLFCIGLCCFVFDCIGLHCFVLDCVVLYCVGLYCCS